jgi:hypothetical protein
LYLIVFILIFRYKLQAKEVADGVDRGDIELSIQWRFNPDVDTQERAQAEKDKHSALKQMERTLGKIGNALVGEVDDDDMDQAEEVSITD